MSGESMRSLVWNVFKRECLWRGKGLNQQRVR
jgi:hypothetical protein